MTIRRREVLAAAGALAAWPVLAQEGDGLVRVELETSEGKIVLALDSRRAPVTTANFLRYVENRRYDGGVFYRSIYDSAHEDYGLIQGGQARSDARRFPGIAHEPTTQTGILNKAGAISMARAAPGSATSDFFILVGDMPGLDANPDAPGDNLGFAAFGHVIEGMDVVRKIQALPTTDRAEVEAMRGQMLAQPVRISAARRVSE